MSPASLDSSTCKERCSAGFRQSKPPAGGDRCTVSLPCGSQQAEQHGSHLAAAPKAHTSEDAQPREAAGPAQACQAKVAAWPEVQDACRDPLRREKIWEWMEMDMTVDADACDLIYDSSAKMSANALELTFPACGISIRGMGEISEFMLQVSRSIPDMSTALEELVVGDDTAEATYLVSGTQVQRVLPMLPLNKFAEWRCVSSLTFNEASLITHECIRVTLDTSIKLSPPIRDGLAETAQLLVSTKEGSQLLQEAMECDGSIGLLEQLRGSVMEAALSHHANHALQKYITVMPAEAVQFIIDGLRGAALEAAQHHTACRVMQRLLEHCPWQQLQPLVDELLDSVCQLVSHRFGNFVVQCLLEHGSTVARGRVADAICSGAAGDAQQLARHWISSNVVRCAFKHGTPQDRARLALAVAPNAHALAKLSKTNHGSFLVRDIKLSMQRERTSFSAARDGLALAV